MTATVPSLPNIGRSQPFWVAIQLGTVRFLGTFWSARRSAGHVIELSPISLRRRSADGADRLCQKSGRWRHGPRIRDRYGYRTFTDFGIAFRLNRFLYALCWTGTDGLRCFSTARLHRFWQANIAAGTFGAGAGSCPCSRRVQLTIFTAALSSACLPRSANVLISLSPCSTVNAKARSTACVTDLYPKRPRDQSGQSFGSMRFAPSQTACRQLSAFHRARLVRWRGLAARQKPVLLRGCPMTGGLQRCYHLRTIGSISG